LAWAVFFSRQPVPSKEAPQRAIAKVKTVACKVSAQFLNRHVATRLEDAQDRAGMRFDRAAAPVATQRPRPQVA